MINILKNTMHIDKRLKMVYNNAVCFAAGTAAARASRKDEGSGLSRAREAGRRGQKKQGGYGWHTFI